METGETPSTLNDAVWIESLSRANQSRERWEDGWQTLASMPGGQVIARRGSLTRVLAPGEFVNLSGSGMHLAPGSTVRVYVPRESGAVQPAYYFAFGETSPDSSDELSTVRFYWNVSAEGAAELLRILSAQLNRWQVPFRFKTGAHPAMLSRRDSAVLYVPRRCAPFTHELLAERLERIGPFLRADVPVFTLRLDKGLAFAEDPGTQESFGMSRCRILAQGLWMAYLEGARNLEERFAAVERHFRSEGIALERPWLNPGSADDLAFAAAEGQTA
ncbi:MAG TPA: T3SS effector HopA1 family protein [Bryobacteraceae bacterium]